MSYVVTHDVDGDSRATDVEAKSFTGDTATGITFWSDSCAVAWFEAHRVYMVVEKVENNAPVAQLREVRENDGEGEAASTPEHFWRKQAHTIYHGDVPIVDLSYWAGISPGAENAVELFMDGVIDWHNNFRTMNWHVQGVTIRDNNDRSFIDLTHALNSLGAGEEHRQAVTEMLTSVVNHHNRR